MGFVGLGSETERSLIANNILDVNPASTSRMAIAYMGGTPSSYVDLENNDLAFYTEAVEGQNFSCLVAPVGGGISDEPSCQVLTPILGVNVTEADNVTLTPAYAAADRAHPTAQGFSLDGTCNLRGLAQVATDVTTDYFGDARDAAPEIGPDECPAP
jgi:hypothetical protein